MFYSAELLSVKEHGGGLGVVWLAATLGPRSNMRRITRKDFTGVDIEETCRFVSAPPQPLSLRLAATLMVGISRIYGQQCFIYHKDAISLYGSLVSATSERSIDPQIHKSTAARKETITISENRNPNVDNLTTDDAFLGALDDFLEQSLNPKVANTPGNININSMETPEIGRLDKSLGTGSSWRSSIPFAGFGSGSIVRASDGSLRRSSMIINGLDVDVPLNDVFDDMDEQLGIFERSLGMANNSVDNNAMDLSNLQMSVVPKIITKHRIRDATKMQERKRMKLFDRVTMLEVDELLLGDGEAMVPAITVNVDEDYWINIDSNLSEESQSLNNAEESIDYVAMSDKFVSPISIDRVSTREVQRSSDTSKSAHVIQELWQVSEDKKNSVEISEILKYLPCTMGKIIKDGQKSEQARIFYALLGMATTGIVRVSQAQPFSAIHISLI